MEGAARRRELGAGDHFGEIALVRGGTRTATVRALTPVHAFRVEAGDLQRLVSRAFRSGMLRSSAGWDLSRDL